MITAVFTLEKTGTDPWGYYTNPKNYLTDGYPSYCAQLNVIMPYYCGDKAKELFPALKVTFEEVSLQKLLVHWESPDSNTIVAWWDYFTDIDLQDLYYALEKMGKSYSEFPGLIGVLQLLYPGDDISLELEFTSVTEDFTKTHMYDYFKEHPYIKTPTMV